MPVLGRTKKDVLSEFRRSELLTAARAVFGRKGFHDASIEEIAEMAEVAKGTVYLYYKSKKDLYLEALRFGLDLLVKQLKARAERPGSCLETLRALAETKIVFFEENGDFFRIYYSELGKLPGHPAALSLVRDLYTQQVKVFEAQNPDAKIVVDYKPEAECLRDLMNDSVRLVIVTRAPTREEEKLMTDKYKFKVPSLRNLDFTPPYMHDGRFFTLGEVLEHYSVQVQNTANLDPLLQQSSKPGIRLTPDDQQKIVSFLKTLNDRVFVTDKRLSEP